MGLCEPGYKNFILIESVFLIGLYRENWKKQKKHKVKKCNRKKLSK